MIAACECCSGVGELNPDPNLQVHVTEQCNQLHTIGSSPHAVVCGSFRQPLDLRERVPETREHTVQLARLAYILGQQDVTRILNLKEGRQISKCLNCHPGKASLCQN